MFMVLLFSKSSLLFNFFQYEFRRLLKTPITFSDLEHVVTDHFILKYVKHLFKG